MGMALLCRECGGRLKVPESAAGKLGKCPQCQALIRVPATAYKNTRICDRCGKLLAEEKVIHEMPGKVYCGKCILKVKNAKDKSADLADDDLGFKPVTPEDKAASVAKPRTLGKGQRAADIFLLRLLTEQEILNEKNITAIMSYQKAVGKRLIPLMRDINLISEEDIVEAICKTTGFEPCPPGKLEIAKTVQDLLDDKTMSRFDAIALEEQEKGVVVALTNPLDVSAVAKLREILGKNVIPRVCAWSQYTSGRRFIKDTLKAKRPKRKTRAVKPPKIKNK